jgi:hypothetical protein
MFALIGCMAGRAQTFEVMKDSVYTYAAIPDTSIPIKSYDWNVSGGTILNSPTGKSIRVRWTGPDGSTATVSVAPVGVNDCKGSIVQQIFSIVAVVPPGSPYAEISINNIMNTVPRTTGNLSGGDEAGFSISLNNLRNIPIGVNDTIAIKYWVNDTISKDTVTYFFMPGATSGIVLLKGKHYENMSFAGKYIEFTVLSSILKNRVVVFKAPELQPRLFKVLGRPQVNKIRYK